MQMDLSKQPMSDFYVWSIRLCSRCVAKNLMVKSNVDRYFLTASSDLGALETTSTRIANPIGNGRDTKQVDLYCGLHVCDYMDVQSVCTDLLLLRTTA